jgi:hypothetical protein
LLAEAPFWVLAMLIFKKGRAAFGNFHSAADNIFPLIPIAQIYTGKYLGFNLKNTILHQSIDIAVASLPHSAIVSATKHLVKKKDQTNQTI